VCSTLAVAVFAGRTGPSESTAVLAAVTVVGGGAARIISASPLPFPLALAVLVPARLSLLQKKPVPWPAQKADQEP